MSNNIYIPAFTACIKDTPEWCNPAAPLFALNCVNQTKNVVTLNTSIWDKINRSDLLNFGAYIKESSITAFADVYSYYILNYSKFSSRNQFSLNVSTLSVHESEIINSDEVFGHVLMINNYIKNNGDFFINDYCRLVKIFEPFQKILQKHHNNSDFSFIYVRSIVQILHSLDLTKTDKTVQYKNLLPQYERKIAENYENSVKVQSILTAQILPELTILLDLHKKEISDIIRSNRVMDELV